MIFPPHVHHLYHFVVDIQWILKTSHWYWIWRRGGIMLLSFPSPAYGAFILTQITAGIVLAPSLCLNSLSLIGSEIKDTRVPKGLHSINSKGAGFRRAQQKLWLQQTADCGSRTTAISACSSSPSPATLTGALAWEMAPSCSSWLCQHGERCRSPCPFMAMIRWVSTSHSILFFFSDLQTEISVSPWPMYWTTWIFNEEWIPTALLHRSQS